MKNNRFNAIAACSLIAGCAGFASADTVTMRYAGNTGLNSVTISGTPSNSLDGNYNGGHLTYQVQGGSSFNTFCVELAEYTNGSYNEYEIVSLADAPRSDTPDSSDDNYGQARADAVVAVIAKAISLGWIDTSLQAGANATTARMSAIQGKIWAALFAATASGSGDVATALSDLDTQSLDNSTYNLMQSRLRAAVRDDAQDQLYVVPLPTSVFAGLGMLGGLAGIRSIRRRQA